jgi:hypothetical protein
MPDLLDQLRDQRTAVRTAQDGILTRAATEQRDLTPEELADHTARSVASRPCSPTRSPSCGPRRSAPPPPRSRTNRS